MRCLGDALRRAPHLPLQVAAEPLVQLALVQRPLQRPPQLPAQLPARARQLRALVRRRYPHSGARARHSTVDVEAGVDHLEAHLRRLSSEKLPPASFDAPVSTEPSLASAILAASTGGAGLLSPSSLRSRAYPDLRPVERGALPEDDVAATTPLVAGREATASSAPREGGPPPRSATERRAATERPKGGGTAKRFRRRAPSPPPGVMIPPDTAAPPQWSALEWVTHQESVGGFAISVRSFDSTSSRGRSSGWAVYAGSADEVSSGDVSDGIARASSAAPRQQRPRE